jgi:hypothetical protein
VVLLVKADRMHESGVTYAQRAALVLRRDADAGAAGLESLDDFLGADRVLVPVPRSSLQKPDSHWPARRICEALREQGFGKGMELMLLRAHALRSSSQSPSGGGRASYQEKLESLAVRVSLDPPDKITIVDDVITTGAETLAAATRIREMIPGADVRAFGMALTRGFVLDVPAVKMPFAGEMRLNRWGNPVRDNPPDEEELRTPRPPASS